MSLTMPLRLKEKYPFLIVFTRSTYGHLMLQTRKEALIRRDHENRGWLLVFIVILDHLSM